MLLFLQSRVEDYIDREYSFQKVSEANLYWFLWEMEVWPMFCNTQILLLRKKGTGILDFPLVVIDKGVEVLLRFNLLSYFSF